MHTRLSYLGGIASIIIAFFPDNNWAKLALGSIGVLSLILAYLFQNNSSSKKEAKSPPRPEKKTFEPLPDHLSVLRVFRENDSELTSTSLIKASTKLETVVINSILDDLVNHKIINPTNMDDIEGWLYQPSDFGRKLIIRLA